MYNVHPALAGGIAVYIRGNRLSKNSELFISCLYFSCLPFTVNKPKDVCVRTPTLRATINIIDLMCWRGNVRKAWFWVTDIVFEVLIKTRNEICGQCLTLIVLFSRLFHELVCSQRLSLEVVNCGVDKKPIDSNHRCCCCCYSDGDSDTVRLLSL